MIVTEAVYVAARAPDAGEDYTALAKTFPAPPASAGILFDGDEGRLSEPALLTGFRGRPARSESEGALCGPGAVPQGSAPGQNHAGSLAVEAEFLRHLD
jgi:hypothetical protein